MIAWFRIKLLSVQDLASGRGPAEVRIANIISSFRIGNECCYNQEPVYLFMLCDSEISDNHPIQMLL